MFCLTEPEVQGALAELKNGRAPGVTGLPSELLRYAEGERTDPEQRRQNALTAVLNSALETRAMPAGLNLRLVTPVPKRGSVASLDIFGPFAVGVALFACTRCCFTGA